MHPGDPAAEELLAIMSQEHEVPDLGGTRCKDIPNISGRELFLDASASTSLHSYMQHIAKI